MLSFERLQNVVRVVAKVDKVSVDNSSFVEHFSLWISSIKSLSKLATAN